MSSPATGAAPPPRVGGRLRGDVVRRLAWPATEVERRRWLVIAIACGVLTTVLLIGAAMARAGSSPQGLTYMGPGSMGAHGAAPLSPLLQDGNLRPGVVAAAVLSCLPPLVLLLQALRVGSAARERKLAGLRVIGASHAHLRRIASAEGAAAGLAGALVGSSATCSSVSCRAAPRTSTCGWSPRSTCTTCGWRLSHSGSSQHSALGEPGARPLTSWWLRSTCGCTSAARYHGPELPQRWSSSAWLSHWPPSLTTIVARRCSRH